VIPLLTIAAGVALAEAISIATGLTPALKWPNDLYVQNRKLGGILAEGGRTPPGAALVVVGFGINLSPSALPPEVASRATSLEGELGRPVDRARILAECLAAVAGAYRRLEAGESPAIVQRWRELARSTLRRPVEWDGPHGALRGIAEDIDENGALLVQTAQGRERVFAGEVRWV
jgi:BirA family biotin operon repressor/biotin-[acetyl-CoA-carboxylase] ligase